MVKNSEAAGQAGDYETYKSLGHDDLLQSLGLENRPNTHQYPRKQSNYLDQRKMSKIIKGEQGSDNDIFAFFDDLVGVNDSDFDSSKVKDFKIDLKNIADPEMATKASNSSYQPLKLPLAENPSNSARDLRNKTEDQQKP